MPAPAHDGNVQQHPTPFPPTLSDVEIPKEGPPDADRFRQSAVVTKLRVLLRCHAAAARRAACAQAERRAGSSICSRHQASRAWSCGSSMT